MLLVSHSGFPSSSIAHTICRNSEQVGAGFLTASKQGGGCHTVSRRECFSHQLLQYKAKPEWKMLPLACRNQDKQERNDLQITFPHPDSNATQLSSSQHLLRYARTMNDPHRERTARVSPAPTEQHKHHYSVSVRAARTLRKGTALSTDICQVTWGKLAEEQMDAESC